jgi:hypothetical protein
MNTCLGFGLFFLLAGVAFLVIPFTKTGRSLDRVLRLSPNPRRLSYQQFRFVYLAVIGFVAVLIGAVLFLKALYSWRTGTLCG